MKIQFKLYNESYDIEEISKEELYKKNDEVGKEGRDYFPYGLTCHYQRKIYLNNEICQKEKEKTLRHELMHAWMYLTANAYQDNYNEEHICEMVSASNEIIYDIVQNYFNN